MEERLPVIKKPNPKSRSSRKLLLLLFLFFITLLAVLFFQSSLSKITKIDIHGQEIVSAEEIGQAAGIQPGDHFFSVSSGKIGAQIKALRMIESVEVIKHFPGRIEIAVKEFPKVAYQIGEGGQVEALLADASVLPVKVQGAKLDKPILTGWAADDPLKKQLCLVMSRLPESAFADISEIKPAPSDSYPDKIKMYTRTKYEVHTTIGYLPDKIKVLGAYIANLQENKVAGGVLKLLEADSHGPAELEDAKKTDKPANKETKPSDKEAKTPEKETKATDKDVKPAGSEAKSAEKGDRTPEKTGKTTGQGTSGS